MQLSMQTFYSIVEMSNSAIQNFFHKKLFDIQKTSKFALENSS